MTASPLTPRTARVTPDPAPVSPCRGRDTLAALGVRVLEGAGTRATEATRDAVRLADGRDVTGGVTVWTVGLRVPDLAARSGLSTDAHGVPAARVEDGRVTRLHSVRNPGKLTRVESETFLAGRERLSSVGNGAGPAPVEGPARRRPCGRSPGRKVRPSPRRAPSPRPGREPPAPARREPRSVHRASSS